MSETTYFYHIDINYSYLMKNEILAKKIENLPDILQKQIEDYVDFLMERYQVTVPESKDVPLTQEEKTELDSRYNNWKNDPSSAIPLEDAKNRLMGKYGR